MSAPNPNEASTVRFDWATVRFITEAALGAILAVVGRELNIPMAIYGGLAVAIVGLAASGVTASRGSLGASMVKQ